MCRFFLLSSYVLTCFFVMCFFSHALPLCVEFAFEEYKH